MIIITIIIITIKYKLYLKYLTGMGMEMKIFGNDKFFSLYHVSGPLELTKIRAWVPGVFGNETYFVWE